MNHNKLLYFSAPSRSGSSLLVTLINCLRDIVLINEPPDSYKIHDRKLIDQVYNLIYKDLKRGFIKQRLDENYQEVTDTFPNQGISWKKKSVKFYPGKSIIGIKKSFPSLGNSDYHKLFLTEWPKFCKWFGKKGGKVVLIIRNPLYTIFSWKTTFDALKADTQTQCVAWNNIASAMIKSKNNARIIKYEDLINDTENQMRGLSKYLGVDYIKEQQFPKIFSDKNRLEYYIKKRGLSKLAIKEIALICKLCDKMSKEFSYDLGRELKMIRKTLKTT